MSSPAVGYTDAQGIFHVGYNDSETRFADHLEKISESARLQLIADRTRLTDLETDVADLDLGAQRIEMTVTTKSIANNSTVTLGDTSPDRAYVEVSDVQAWHNAVTNPQRITPGVAGRYEFAAEIEWASNATGLRQLTFTKNGVGSNQIRQMLAASTDSVASCQLRTEYEMNGTTDYIQVHVFQNSGGALNVSGRVYARLIRRP